MIFIISFLAGILGGMGIGGGAILIPALVLLLGISQHTAQAINLCYFIPTALCALAVHAKNKTVRFREGLFLTLGGLPAALIASFLAIRVTEPVLRRLFALFLFVSAFYEFLRKENRPMFLRKENRPKP